LGVFGLKLPTAIWLLFVLGVVNALLYALVFRDSPRQHPRVNELESQLIAGSASASTAAATDGPMTVTEMLRSMTPRSLANLGWLCVQSTLSTFADNIYSNWIPLFLAQVHHLEFKEMGISSALPLLGGAIAGLIGGILNDLAISRAASRRWSR